MEVQLLDTFLKLNEERRLLILLYQRGQLLLKSLDHKMLRLCHPVEYQYQFAINLQRFEAHEGWRFDHFKAKSHCLDPQHKHELQLHVQLVVREFKKLWGVFLLQRL